MSVNKIFWVVTCWTVIVSCCLFCTSKPQGCGIRSLSGRARIIGGRPSNRGQWPWHVAIFRNGRIWCGGALIHARWVLTAAHCLYGFANTDSYTIKAGKYDISIKESTEQERQVRQIIPHPHYRDYPPYDNDIALIEVSQDFNLTTGYVSTICLPKAGENLSTPGAVVNVAGWGVVRWKLPLRNSAILLHSAYSIRNNNVCRRATRYYLNQKVTFCTGDGKGGSGTCFGDSGGSLIRNVTRSGTHRWVTVGLVSWGEGCSLPGKYDYNTRVEVFVDWIRKAVVKTKCDGSPLGMESGAVPQSNIQPSSSRWYFYNAKHGRLNGRNAWCSGTASNPYLQVDFGKPYWITALATQGSAYLNKWVARYTVKTNLAGSLFNMYRENNRDKVFVGNTDSGSIVRNKLRHPVIARRLRIYPQKRGGFSYFSPACMRVEIYGCLF